MPGTLGKENRWLSWPCSAVLSFSPLCLLWSGVLPSMCRAGRSGWSGGGGAVQEISRGQLAQGRRAPAEGRGALCFLHGVLCAPQLPHAAGCLHPTGHTALPCTLAPAQHRSRSGASAASSLRVTQGAQHNASGCPLHLDSQPARPGTPQSWTQCQQPPLVPGKPSHPPWYPWGLAPASPESCLAHPGPCAPPGQLPGCCETGPAPCRPRRR